MEFWVALPQGFRPGLYHVAPSGAEVRLGGGEEETQAPSTTRDDSSANRLATLGMTNLRGNGLARLKPRRFKLRRACGRRAALAGTHSTASLRSAAQGRLREGGCPYANPGRGRVSTHKISGQFSVDERAQINSGCSYKGEEPRRRTRIEQRGEASKKQVLRCTRRANAARAASE